MHRKITRTGPATLTVSLPAKWAKRNNLQPGQEIDVNEIGNTLQISITQDGGKNTKRIPYDASLLESMLEKLFLDSTQNIIVYSDATIPKSISKIVQKFPGFQVTEYQDHKVTIQRTLKPGDYNPKALLRRCYRVLRDGLAQNPPRISQDISSALFLLQLHAKESKEVYVLKEMFRVLPECENPIHDDAYHLIRTIFEIIYSQKYSYSSTNAKRIEENFKDINEVFQQFFSQDKQYLTIAKVYYLIQLLHQLHNELLQTQGEGILAKLNRPRSSKYKVGVCLISKANVYWEQEVKESMQNTAINKNEVEFIFEAPLSNVGVTSQKKILQKFIDAGVDGIVYVPIDPTNVSDIIRKINKLNIPLVNLDTELEVKNAQYNFIGFDNHKGGYLAGQHIKSLIKKNASVLVVEGYPFGNSPKRIKGFVEGLGASHKATAVQGEFQQSVAYERTKKYLEKHKTAAIFAANDSMAIGAAKAASELGLDIPVCGFDMTKEGIEAMREGILSSTINTKPRFLGELAIEQVTQVMEGKRIAERVEYDVELVTKETIHI